MSARFIRALEHRIDGGGSVYVAQVCSPDTHAAAPASAGGFDVQTVTRAADNLHDFHSDDPALLARGVTADVRERMPKVPEIELGAFFNEIVEGTSEHRRLPAELARAVSREGTNS